MTIREILEYPDERLHTIAEPVQTFDANLKKLTEDMLETMYANNGIGLAATQINVHQRVVVIDLQEEDEKKPLILINPKIINNSESKQISKEGCLSVPGIYDEVQRYEKISIETYDLENKKTTINAENLLAICIQHEIDHLNGKVFVQYLSSLKENRIKKKLIKKQKKSK